MLLIDLTKQTFQPGKIVIIDGDPESKDVIALLRYLSLNKITGFKYDYIPTNHSNVSYHRFLGWKAAYNLKFKFVVYIDDDIRIYQQNAIEITVLPLIAKTNNVIGVTGNIKFGKSLNLEKNIHTTSALTANKTQSIMKKLTKRRYLPGSLTSTGIRIKPNQYSHDGYGVVEWASGGVMAFSLIKPGEELFSIDSFALHHIGYGLADDTILSQSLSRYGNLLLAKNAEFHHPSTDDSKVIPSQPYKRGFAVAYSRRLIIENHKINYSSSVHKYFELLRSYVGNFIIQFVDILRRPDRIKMAYSFGYFSGSVVGLFRKPTAKYLTPEINWFQDAETAISRMVEF